jgi:hypothetical protein
MDSCPKRILGFPLPDRLRHLISVGRWEMPSDSNRFAEVTGFKDVDHVEFFQADSIKRESRALQKMSGGVRTRVLCQMATFDRETPTVGRKSCT